MAKIIQSVLCDEPGEQEKEFLGLTSVPWPDCATVGNTHGIHLLQTSEDKVTFLRNGNYRYTCPLPSKS
jgi:hypothetical protein